MKKVIKKKVVKKVVEKEKTLEELDREIKYIRTEWRSDYSSCRTLVRRGRRDNPGRLYKCLKIPDKGFAVLIYEREKKIYENATMGKEWRI